MVLEDGGGAAIALEDGGGVAVLRGDVGQRLKTAAVALGGGGNRRTCKDGVSVKGLLLQHWRQHWQGRQERMCTMRGMYVGSNGKEIGILQWWWWRRW